MKEIMRQTHVLREGLTSQAQEGYSKGGDIFMEGKSDMAPQNSQPTNPERAEKTRQAPKLGVEEPVSAEKQAQVRKLWGEANEGRVIPLIERRTIDLLVEKGLAPVAGGAEQQPPEIKMGPATWKTKDTEQSVNVTGYAGKGEDGRDYVNVEGSATALPLDEIEFPATTEAGVSGAGVPPDEPPRAPPVGGQPEEPDNGGNEGEDIGSGITDPKLLNEINAIESSLTAGLPPEETLAKALERIALFDTNYGTAQEQEQRSQQRQILLQRIQNRVKNVINKIVKGRLTARQEGLYGERKLTQEEKQLIKEAKKPEDIEELFNRMFDTVDSLPQVDFDTGFGSIGQFEYAEFLKVLNEEISELNNKKNFVRAKELGDIRTQFSKEKSSRTIIHNAYFAVISGQNTEAVSNYMASFLTGYADLAFGKAGVVQAMHFYEQALLIVREKHGGYLPAKDVIGNLKDNKPGEVNILTEELLRKANDEGRLVVGENGEPILDAKNKTQQLAKWELDRALSFARGMSVVTGRSIEIAATSILPGMESGSSAFIDLFAQKIIQELYLRHSGVKFQMTKANKVTRVLAYILDRNKSPWTPKEIQEFDKMGMEEQIKVLNDLMPEGKERFLSILNPFEIGGWLSRTGWRIGGDPENPGESAIKKMMEDPKERGWIGTGIIIEKLRDKLEKLESHDRKEKRGAEIAKRKIEEALKRTARVTPLRFFLNMREFKERVLMDLLKKDSQYFSSDEKKRLLIEIREQFKAKEAIKTEIEIEEEKLVGKKVEDKKETPEEKLKKEKKRKADLITKIAMDSIMRNSRFSEDMRNLVLLQDQAVSRRNEELIVGEIGEDGKAVVEGKGEIKLGRILYNQFLNGEAKVKVERTEGENKIYLEETYLQAFVRRLEHKGWKTPFVFGTEDVPYNKYVFEETGPRGGARRWADMAAGAKAGAAFGEFLSGIEHYTEQGQIVEAMYKIYHNIKDYNLEYAEKFTQQLAEGVMKFYRKTWTHRLPLGIGTANSMISGESSYAQIAFGRGKMAWDELQQNEFTRLLRDKGLISVEQQHELQERAGGGKKEVVWSYTRTVLPLIMMALAYYVISKTFKEERS